MTDDKYDVIVIGTGCGGAAAAALASYHGHKTLVLEKNHYIGGRASTYEKQGFKMDHGHVLMRCQKGPHGKLLRMVKCRDLIPKFSLALNWGIRPVFDDMITTVHPRPYLIEWPFIALKEILPYRFSLLELIEYALFCAAATLMPRSQIKNYDKTDAKSMLNMFSRNKYFHLVFGGILTVTMGAPLTRASGGEFFRVINSGIWDFLNMGYPVGGAGISAIPNAFMRAAKQYGADIRLNTPADTILVEDNEIKGVIAGGRKIAADKVISNAGLSETVFKLVGEDKFDTGYTERIKNLTYSYAGLSLKYALDKKITDYVWCGEIPGNFDQVIEDMTEGRLPERLPWMAVVTSNIDKKLAPEGKQLICVISGGAPIKSGEIDWKPWMERVKQQVEEYFPTLKDHLMFCDESTPDEIARAVGRIHADAVGVSQTTDQVGDRRPSPVSPIKGLFYTGTDVGRDNVATELATESAIALEPYLKTGRTARRCKQLTL